MIPCVREDSAVYSAWELDRFASLEALFHHAREVVLMCRFCSERHVCLAMGCWDYCCYRDVSSPGTTTVQCDWSTEPTADRDLQSSPPGCV